MNDSAQPIHPGDAHEREVLDLLRRGEKIEAIKRVRQWTGLGLKEAKDAVEALARRHNIDLPTVTIGGTIVVLAILLGLALIAGVAMLALF
jgi:hypothetical protein